MALDDRLCGQHTTTLDNEGRLLLAKMHRDVLAPEGEELDLAVMLEPSGALSLRLAADWEARLARLEALPESSARARMLAYLAGHSAALRMDRQGRVRIPDWLLEKADLDRRTAVRREATFVGVGGHLEVWSPERRRQHESLERQRFAATWDELHTQAGGFA